MFEAASLLGPCLLALGLVDTRARLMALLLVLVWGETALFDMMASTDMAVIMKPLIDFVGGIMAIGIVTRERWSVMVPALFAVMLLCHSAYWLAWHNGIDLWYVYAHALTALWLLQCAAVAWPAGRQAIGRASSYMGARLSARRACGHARDGSDLHCADKESV